MPSAIRVEDSIKTLDRGISSPRGTVGAFFLRGKTGAMSKPSCNSSPPPVFAEFLVMTGF